MTLQELLNTDMATLGRWARQALAWWSRELVELTPRALRGGDQPGARLRAEPLPDGGFRLRGADGTPLPADAGRAGPVDLLLPADAVLRRELEMPRLSTADLRRAVAMNLDQLTPFAPDRVYFDVEPLERRTPDGKTRLRLGVIPRDRAGAVLERAAEAGLRVRRLRRSGERGGEFDFMPAVRAEAGDPADRRRAALWAVCGGLAALNVLVAVVRDRADVRQLRDLVEAQQPAVDLAMRLRRAVAAEQAARVAQLSRRSVREPLRILDAATRALPKGAWLQRLEWNGRAVRLVGLRPPGFDPLAAFPGPALTNPRSLLSDATPRSGTGPVPFDLVLDAPARPPGRPRAAPAVPGAR